VDAAIHPSEPTTHNSDTMTPAKNDKKGSRLLGFFKSTTKAVVRTAIGTDALKAKAGSEPAKHRLGAVPSHKANLLSGPVEFMCRYDGAKGHVYIFYSDSTPYLAFSTDKMIAEHGTVSRNVDLKPLWTVDMTQIAELRKVGGFKWAAKLVVGWALEREVADGLEICMRDGTSKLVTAVPLRDELFNRACAIGGQVWECL